MLSDYLRECVYQSEGFGSILIECQRAGSLSSNIFGQMTSLESFPPYLRGRNISIFISGSPIEWSVTSQVVFENRHQRPKETNVFVLIVPRNGFEISLSINCNLRNAIKVEMRRVSNPSDPIVQSTSGRQNFRPLQEAHALLHRVHHSWYHFLSSVRLAVFCLRVGEWDVHVGNEPFYMFPSWSPICHIHYQSSSTAFSSQ